MILFSLSIVATLSAEKVWVRHHLFKKVWEKVWDDRLKRSIITVEGAFI